MTTENEWEEVATNGPAVTNLRNEPVYELTKYIYVISRSKFVLCHNPSSEKSYSKTQFNIKNAHLEDHLPDGMAPSDYILSQCRDTNVVNHIDMFPKRPLIYLDEDGDKVFNVFPPNIPIPPDADLPDPQPFLDHLFWLYNENQEHVDHVLMWMAHVLYKPEKRIIHGLLTSGDYGNGKSMIADVMEALIAERGYNKVAPHIFLDRFADWIEGTRLAVVEEVEMFEQGRNFDKIKENFSGNRFSVNPKGKPTRKINNFVHYLFYSNHVNPMPIMVNDRRLWYVHTRGTAAEKGSRYYDWLFDEFLDPHANKPEPKLGCFAVAKYLRDKILPIIPETFATTPPPVTQDKARAILSYKGDLEELIEDEIESAVGLFAPRQFFRWKSLKSLVKESTGISLSHTKHESTIQRMGITRKRCKINGKLEDICWLETDKEFSHDLEAMFKDTTNAGREKLMSHFYEQNGPQF